MTALSTANGVNSTKLAALNANTGSLSDLIDGANEWGTKLRVLFDKYTVPSGDTISSTGVLTMGTLPKGARVLFFHFTQDAAGEAAVGTIKIATVDAAGSNVLTDMTSATKQLVPANDTFAITPLTVESAVTITFATQDVDAGTILTLATCYLIED
ncbi:hypothetical protein LCGC14_1223280 [marine sediment metagenome]|uniref:Uncharacterized protein n=1 Tax=marine sediment metagenome TaxID=412755 RepID=A0A0F9LAR6_9ZZZZ